MHDKEQQASLRVRRNLVRMVLILEMCLWIIPLTLVLAPCRQLTRLVATIQQIKEEILSRDNISPSIQNRVERIQMMSMAL